MTPTLFFGRTCLVVVAHRYRLTFSNDFLPVRSTQKTLVLFVLHTWMRMQQMQIANAKR